MTGVWVPFLGVAVLILGLVVIPGLLPRPDGSPGFLFAFRRRLQPPPRTCPHCGSTSPGRVHYIHCPLVGGKPR